MPTPWPHWRATDINSTARNTVANTADHCVAAGCEDPCVQTLKTVKGYKKEHVPSRRDKGRAGHNTLAVHLRKVRTIVGTRPCDPHVASPPNGPWDSSISRAGKRSPCDDPHKAAPHPCHVVERTEGGCWLILCTPGTCSCAWLSPTAWPPVVGRPFAFSALGRAHLLGCPRMARRVGTS